MITTRFAPSPTGLLHIGGARTALFNWLFSKANNGRFLLRIEDTDKSRSTEKAVLEIIKSMEWLGLNHDGEIVFQSSREKRHKEVAEQLLDTGHAYRCYLSTEEIEKMRAHHMKILSPWRDSKFPISNGTKPVIRIKIRTEASTTISDQIKGDVSISNCELDDMILLRSDGTPTYMMAVVVDDYDMGITHVIRGEDHFTNTFRQMQIIKALQWPIPTYAHIPLINGEDGVKLSKRHGAVSVSSYKEIGYLPEALCNYLLKLGWSHNDIEIITKEEAIKIFSLTDINRSSARFDLNKLNSLNSHYISRSSNNTLLNYLDMPNEEVKHKIMKAMDDLKVRANTISELQEISNIYYAKKKPADQKSLDIIQQHYTILELLIHTASNIANWDQDNIKKSFEELAIDQKFSSGKMMQILRAFTIGSFKSPGIYETLHILGKEEVISRLKEPI